jgi:hypothetical protein
LSIKGNSLVPRQNRVTPFGDIVAIPEYGTFMGNRGNLHDADGRIKRAWQVRRWLACVLEFRGRKRAVMRPGYYTELFFLDEATALAAGHRPCAECRHARFIDFCHAWARARPADGKRGRPSAMLIDDRLHSERMKADQSKRTFVARLDDLPDGVLVIDAALGRQPYLVRGCDLLAWSPSGYVEQRRRPKGREVEVLTPESTVGTISAGYVPEVHASAEHVVERVARIQ